LRTSGVIGVSLRRGFGLPAATAATAIAAAATTVTAAAVATTATTATTTTTAISATAAAEAATAATTTFGGTVDLDITAVEFGAIKCTDGFFSALEARIRHETEATAATTFAVTHNNGILNLAEFFKLLTEQAVVRIPGQTTNEQLN
jgi:cytoskeletal protein RodZ